MKKIYILLFFATTLAKVLFAQPVITSFSPASAITGGIVNISGTGFTGAQSVTFGNIPASSFTVIFDTLIRAVVGTGATGDIAIRTPLGTGSKPGFTFVSSLQQIKLYSFSPSGGATGTTITIRGKNLTGAGAVHFGGMPAQSFSVISDSIITAVVGTGKTGMILVQNSVGYDSLLGFTFISPPPPVTAPHLTSFTPTSAAKGATVRIYGMHLNGITSVTFGGTPAQSFSIVTDSLISAVVGTGASGNIVVNVPNAMDSLSGFTFINPPPPPGTPHLVSFAPANAARGTTVRISGAHLTGITAVRFGGTPAQSFSIVTDSLISAVVGTGASGAILVNGPNGVDSMSGFTFINPPPPPPPVVSHHLTSFAPDSAVKGATVRINGAHLTGITDVRFGGTPVQSFTVVTDSLIYAVVGAGASGNIVVNGPNGMDSLPGFKFINTRPVIPQTLNPYPNPGHGYTVVAVPATTSASQFELVDMNGQVVQKIPVSPGTAQVKIVLTNLKNGVYKLVWSDGSNYSYQTVLILK